MYAQLTTPSLPPLGKSQSYSFGVYPSCIYFGKKQQIRVYFFIIVSIRILPGLERGTVAPSTHAPIRLPLC